MAVTVVFLPVNTLTILQKGGLSPLNRYTLYIHNIITLFFGLILFSTTFFIYKHLKVTFASFSTVPHASIQEINDLGNPQSEAAIEDHNNLV